MSGYVVCQACGTRIKAGREHCLRCFAPLPHPDEPVKPPLSVSLGLSRQNQIILSAIALTCIAGLLFVILMFEAPAIEEETTQPRLATAPLPVQAPSPEAGAAAAPGAPAASGGAAPTKESTLPMPSVPQAVVRSPDAPADPALEQRRDEYLAQLGRSPNDAATVNRLGLLFAQMGQNDEALTRFDRAINLDPRRVEFRMNYANLAASLGQWGRAINQYREALLITPRDFAAELGLAIAFQRKGDDDMAIAEFEKARHLKPDDATVALGLGASFERLGRKDDAAREYRSFMKMQPNSPDADKVRIHLANGPQVK